MAIQKWEDLFNATTNRRNFIAGSLAGCSALLASSTDFIKLFERAQAGLLTSEEEYLLNKAENTIATACMQCNTGCAVKVKFLDGMLAKIDGNPYSPWTLNPHLSYGATIKETENVDAAICPKGQAGLQAYYDPYRIRRVLKRAGKRGENKWVSIPFDQAVEEIVNGGALFSHVPGEEQRQVEGLSQLWAIRDPKVAKDMADAVAKILAEKDKTKKAALVEEFKVNFNQQLAGSIHWLSARAFLCLHRPYVFFRTYCACLHVTLPKP